MACKAEDIYYLALERKSWPILVYKSDWPGLFQKCRGHERQGEAEALSCTGGKDGDTIRCQVDPGLHPGEEKALVGNCYIWGGGTSVIWLLVLYQYSFLGFDKGTVVM